MSGVTCRWLEEMEADEPLWRPLTDEAERSSSHCLCLNLFNKGMT